MSALDWLKDVEIKDLLEKDTRLIADYCGMDVLISLWEQLPSLSLFISTKPLTEAKKRFIRMHYDGANVKLLAAKLGVSERFVYEVVAAAEEKDKRQGKMF